MCVKEEGGAPPSVWTLVLSLLLLLVSNPHQIPRYGDHVLSSCDNHEFNGRTFQPLATGSSTADAPPQAATA